MIFLKKDDSIDREIAFLVLRWIISDRMILLMYLNVVSMRDLISQ